MTGPSSAVQFLISAAGAPQPAPGQSAGQEQAAAGGFLRALAVAALAAVQGAPDGGQEGLDAGAAAPAESCDRDAPSAETPAAAAPMAAPLALLTALPAATLDCGPAGTGGGDAAGAGAIVRRPEGPPAAPGAPVREDAAAAEQNSAERAGQPESREAQAGSVAAVEGRPGAGSEVVFPDLPEDARHGGAGVPSASLPAGKEPGEASDAARHSTPDAVEPGAGRPESRAGSAPPGAPADAPSERAPQEPEAFSETVRLIPQDSGRVRETPRRERSGPAPAPAGSHVRLAAEAAPPDGKMPPPDAPAAQVAPSPGLADSADLASAREGGEPRPEAPAKVRLPDPGQAGRGAAILSSRREADGDRQSAGEPRPAGRQPSAAGVAASALDEAAPEHHSFRERLAAGMRPPGRDSGAGEAAPAGLRAGPPDGGAAAQTLPEGREALPVERPARAEPAEARALEPPRLVDQVVRAIELTRRGPATDLTVHLDPPELGVLRVKVTLTDGTISAQLRADSPEVHRLLLTGQGELREALQQAGLRVDEIRVPQFASGFADSGRQSQPRQDQARHRRAVFAPSLDAPRSAVAFAGMAWLARTDSRALVDRFA